MALSQVEQEVLDLFDTHEEMTPAEIEAESFSEGITKQDVANAVQKLVAKNYLEFVIGNSTLRLVE